MELQKADRRARNAWLAVLAALPLALVLVLSLLANALSRGQELSRQLEVSYAARTQVYELLSLHQDLELGQRGYLLTENPTFLEPYHSARDSIDAMFRETRQKIGRSPALGQLEAVSQAKLRFVDRTIDLARNGQRAQAVAMVASGRGKRLMDEIREQIAVIEHAETAKLGTLATTTDEAYRWVRLLVVAVFVFLGVLVVLALLVTLRARARGKAATQRFRDSSARQSAIFESASDGIVTINPSGSIEKPNAALLRMTGYEFSELERRDIGVLFEIAPDEGQGETFLRRLARKAAGQTGGAIELWGRRKDGSLFPCDVTISPVPLAQGMTFVAIVRDTSERRQVEQMKNEFVSTVSHELRTPLTSISGSLGLVAGGAAGALPPQADRLIRIALSNCERLVRLINDILDIEKIESGKMTMHLESIALAPFIDQAVQANRAFGETFGVDIVAEAVPEHAMVTADADRLMQVLTNLLSNAAKFSSAGDTVTVTVAPLDRRWRITVRDQGMGIPESFKSKVFGKFAQADTADTRQKGGTGLGLSIVREIVTRMGGAVSFDSEEGDGAAFHVDLPSPAGALIQHAEPDGRPCVLYVEDDPDMRELVAATLRGRATLYSVPTLAGARDILRGSSFDVVILDFALPDGDGAELLPQLRAAKIPVVAFTAQDVGAELTGAVSAVLVKSRASLDQLVDVLRAELASRGLKMKGEEG